MSVRQADLELPSGDDVCRAWYFLPDGAEAPIPCIVMAHGLGLTRHCGLRELAFAFASEGYAVLAFDYRGFGDSGGQPRQVISFSKQLADWQAAIDFARAQSDVDSSRIVAWGYSLGAGHALTAAARDEEVTAVVAVVPMFDGLSSTFSAVKRWSPGNFLRVIGRAAKDLLGSCFGRQPALVPLAAPPGELGLLTSADARPGYDALVPPNFNYGTAARIAVLFWNYFPGLRLRRFSRPILIFPSRIDQINPAGPTHRHARSCESATIVELDCAHMAALLEPQRSRVVRETLDFLTRCLGSGKVE